MCPQGVRALELLRQHRAAETLVVLGRDIGRPAEALRSLTLGELTPEMVSAGVPPCWNSYVNSADCAATEAKVKELGGQVNFPTTEVPGHGKLAFFQDPEGASFAAWESTTDEGPGLLAGDPCGLSWNELMNREGAKASKFYGDLFGWKLESMPMGDIDYTMIKNAGKDAGGMMKMEGPQFEGIPAHWLVYFAVEDCDASAAKAAESGGAIHVPPTEIPVGKFCVLGDPQGAGFAIIQVAAVPGA